VRVARVELDGRHLLREQAESSFDVRLVLRALGRCADAHRVVERCIDFRGVVRGTVVEELRERRVASGLLAVFERLDDGGAVLFVAHADADRSVTRRVDDELEVHAKGLTVEHDLELLAVADPLRAGEEGLEAAAQRLLVARSTGASRGGACAVLEQDARDKRVAELESMISAHVRAERAEGSVPRAPRDEHGLDLRVPCVLLGRWTRVGDIGAGVVLERVGLGDIGAAVALERVGRAVASLFVRGGGAVAGVVVERCGSHPVLQRAERELDRLGEIGRCHLGVSLA
jgi:hypothetical protein